ncbi:MAG: ORF6C domain-containing protein [Helicobacteraceae bacterium]|jgi:hypothetical protein|nr:ORF6C domain-containing protein [Helicobacteraceae bacterium]
MKEVVKINGIDIEVNQYRDTWAINNKQVSEAFGVEESAIRQQKARGEFREGVHFYGVTNCHTAGGGGSEVTMWTKKGVITLGFKLRETPRTIAFRDWASDYILGVKNYGEKMSAEAFTMSAIASIANNFLAIEKKIENVENNFAELKNTASLTAAEQKRVQRLIKMKVAAAKTRNPLLNRSELFAFFYRQIKTRFDVASYADLPHYRLDDVLRAIDEIKMPDSLFNTREMRD